MNCIKKVFFIYAKPYNGRFLNFLIQDSLGIKELMPVSLINKKVLLIESFLFKKIYLKGNKKRAGQTLKIFTDHF